MAMADIITVARGDAPADLVLANARIINVFNGEIESGNVAISSGRIAGIGDYRQADEVIDLKGAYLAPGLIDGHTHIESSMLHPVRYAEAVVPHGTTSLVTDLHEITNVCGMAGIEFVRKWARQLPLDMFFMAPSCVPATHLETSGADIGPGELAMLRRLKGVLGLGEMMNFPGVVLGFSDVLDKINIMTGRVRDGHAPGLSGKQLNAYISAGIGSDHECTRLEEAREKLARGMHIMIREGSSEKNLDALLPLVNQQTARRCLFVVDDRSCTDLLHEGDIDAVVRKAISRGLDPVTAIQLATLNTAEYFRLYDYGGIAPGFIANLVTITDLGSLAIDCVFYHGRIVARNGKIVSRLPADISRELDDTVRIKPFDEAALKLHISHDEIPVIEVVPHQIVTRKTTAKVALRDGVAQMDVANDILKIVVVERHRATGNIGIGLVKGFGLKRGAIASSIAHDSHNIVAIGVNDNEILGVVRQVEKMHGGLAVYDGDQVMASLPLPVAGLLSPEPLEQVCEKFSAVERAAANLGDVPPSPFSLLSFLALPVIPELKLTDRGVVDVGAFKLVDL